MPATLAEVAVAVPERTEDKPMQSLHIRLADIPSSRFVAHGDFHIWTEGSLLCYEVQGPFNLEFVRALGAARQKIVHNWNPQHPVGAIVHWRQTALMTPEAFAAYAHSFTQFNQSTLAVAALAWVADHTVEGMQLLGSHFVALFQKIGTNFRFFETEAPAREWVAWELQKAASSSPPLGTEQR